MLIFDPYKRIDVETCLADPYFKNLHAPEDEAVASAVLFLLHAMLISLMECCTKYLLFLQYPVLCEAAARCVILLKSSYVSLGIL